MHRLATMDTLQTTDDDDDRRNTVA